MESAKSRLSLCAEDIRGQIETMGNTSELCSQLGAVLGMLGDCWSVLCVFRMQVVFLCHKLCFVGFQPMFEKLILVE